MARKTRKVNPYSDALIEKVKGLLLAALAIFNAIPVKALKVSISKGNRKIGRVMNVSLAPLLTCGNCSKCKYYCYDLKAVLQYTNVCEARARNTSIWQRDPDLYFSQIRKAIKARRTRKFFRWHVSGDIPNKAYFAEMVAIARENPDFIFWTYTKMYWLVNSYCNENGGRSAVPENLSVMFSEWDGVPVVNPYGFPQFCCKFPEGNKNHPAEYFDNIFPCPGNCDVCLDHHTGCPYGRTSYVNLH